MSAFFLFLGEATRLLADRVMACSGDWVGLSLQALWR